MALVICSRREYCEALLPCYSRRRPAIAVYQNLSSRAHSDTTWSFPLSPLPRPNAVRHYCAMWLCGVVRTIGIGCKSWRRDSREKWRGDMEPRKTHGVVRRWSVEGIRRRQLSTSLFRRLCFTPSETSETFVGGVEWKGACRQQPSSCGVLSFFGEKCSPLLYTGVFVVRLLARVTICLARRPALFHLCMASLAKQVIPQLVPLACPLKYTHRRALHTRSMDELLEGRKAALSVQTRIGLAHSHPHHRSDSALSGCGQAPAAEHAWKPWGSHGNATGGTATTAAMTSGARSTTSDAFHPGGRAPHEDSEDQPGDHCRWQDHATRRTRDRNGLSPSAAILPPPPPLRPPPLVSVAALRASLRGPGGKRSPSPAVGSIGVGREPSLRPRAHARSPNGLNNSREGARPRPQPRRAPSEDDCDRGAGNGEAAKQISTGDGGGNDGVGEGDECGSEEEGGEWWVGGCERQVLDGEPSGLQEGANLRQDTPLHVVSL